MRKQRVNYINHISIQQADKYFNKILPKMMIQIKIIMLILVIHNSRKIQLQIIHIKDKGKNQKLVLSIIIIIKVIKDEIYLYFI